MSQQDMTWQEVRDALKKLRAEVGPTASLSVDIKERGLQGYIAFATRDRDSKYWFVEGNSFAEVLSALHATWATYCDEHSAGLIRKMALRIVTITADQGACTASALRMTGDFSDAEIAAHGPAACEEANRLASNGPFSIVTTNSNQVAAE